MATQVIIKPTFLLKSIDPFALSKEYSQGQNLSNLTFEKKNINTIALMTNRGKSFRDAIYTFRNKDNFIQTIVTTGAKNFSFVNEQGEIQHGGQCLVCRCDISGESLGIPIRLAESGEKLLVFKLYSTCDFRCTLRLIRFLQCVRRRPINLTHAEQFLRYLYRRMHPEGPPLQESPDPLLFKTFDGPLTQDEYKDPRYNYIPTPNIILYPAKEQYLRLQ